MILFRFTATTARASAALAGGTATIDTENAVIAANGVGKGVALTTVSGSVASTSATIEPRIVQSEGNGAHPLGACRLWVFGDLLYGLQNMLASSRFFCAPSQQFAFV